MAKLHSLIRFKRHTLDEKRQLLAALNAELEGLQEHKKLLLEKIAHEKNLASVDLDAARSFTAYLHRAMEQSEALDTAILEKRAEVQAATQVVQEAFLDAKKFEVTQENRDRQEAERLNKIESDTLDEIGLTGFIRQQGDTSL